MASSTLTAASPLDGIRLDFANLTIEEITGRALVSLAVPLGGSDAFAEAMQARYGVQLAAAGTFARATSDNALVINMAPDQYFVLFDDPGGDPVKPVRQRLGQTAYLVDQSDSWVQVRMSGDNSRAALERMCPLDLDPAVFGPGSAARTMMEHLSVIILCVAANHYVLLSPRSSAGSFLHAIETSARNVS